MLRHALALIAVTAAFALAAPGCGNEQLSVADYDTTCDDASDCSAVYIGECSSDMCPNAAINTTDLAKYQGDANALDCEFSPGCTTKVSVTCKAGKCAVGK
jgi:hypothetical protein